ncbi:ISL3 family transposase [Streptomyces sp. NPDC046557]|uniref:ISL3 family transposase n=1 Tax=Streptomyces sp. NPDC046557 TaxID=3155372 RepID=UPI0033C437B6
MFPHLVTVLVERVVVESGVLRIAASTKDGMAAVCPGCGALSTRVHSRYGRKLADAPVGTRPVLIELSVRRLFCDNSGCARVTFAEQVEGLTSRYGRLTPVLQRIVGALGVVLAARAVVRLGLVLGIVVSRMTVLRVLMALPEPAWAVPRVLGVDEFATSKGRRYGTILIDCETHQPLDLLPDREAETLSAWLREHPGVEIVCRDRAACFAESARTGAPQAQHCADKWHVWHNLGEAVERLVSHHRVLLRDLVEPEPEPEPEPGPVPTSVGQEPSEPYPAGKFLDRLRDTHAADAARPVARPDQQTRLLPALPAATDRRGLHEPVEPPPRAARTRARCAYSTLRDYVHPLRPGRPPAANRPPMARPPSTRESHPLDHEPPRPPTRRRQTAAQDAAGPVAGDHSRHHPRPDVRDHHDQP